MNVLIVEDNPVNREFLTAIMEGHGKCVGVETAEDALAHFERALERDELFDLVFMDIILPGMDGLQALEKLRAMEKDKGLEPEKISKVIVTTALDDDQKASRAFFQGQALSYITKPFTIDKITKELEKFGLAD